MLIRVFSVFNYNLLFNCHKKSSLGRYWSVKIVLSCERRKKLTKLSLGESVN